MTYDATDMYSNVCLFNLAAKATEEVYSPQDPETFNRIERQVKLLAEEFDELLVALLERDKTEVLKETLDVGVVWMGIVQILENAGYAVWDAAEAVCENNNSKIMNNPQDASESVEKHHKEGVEAYVDTTRLYNSDYYSVRRKSDGKILKPHYFEKVDVSKHTPIVH